MWAVKTKRNPADAHEPSMLISFMTPTKARVILIPIAKEDKEQQTSAGLYLPRAVTDNVKYVEGNVLAVGPDVKQIKVGDKVLYAKEHANYLSNDAGMEVVLIEDEHISVVIESQPVPRQDPAVDF